jgi:hypothetical protein
MLAKCSNPVCDAPFRYLGDGKLFRLETDPTLRIRESRRWEYFWLCSRCSSTMTLRLEDDETVAAVLLPEPMRDVSDDAFILVDRKRGLLLRSVSSAVSEHRARPIDRHHVA